MLAENYKEFDLYYEKICYEILSKHYETLSDEYKNTCYASYFVELVDYFSYENVESEGIYLLLYYIF